MSKLNTRTREGITSLKPSEKKHSKLRSRVRAPPRGRSKKNLNYTGNSNFKN